MLNEFCGGKFQNTKYFADTIRKVDLVTSNWTSTYMCSDLCPCPYDSLSLNYTSKWKSDDKLHIWGRTLKNNESAAYSIFKFTSEDEAYYTFEDCYNDILANSTNNTNISKQVTCT